MNILEKINSGIVFFDGGTGSVLQSMGLKSGEPPESWSIEQPEKIIKLHRDYYEAGADIIKLNTFGVNGLKYSEKEIAELVNAAIGCANAAKGDKPERYTALDLGPLGKLLEPIGELPFEDAVEAFAKTVRAAGDRTDLILIETMGDAYEIKAAVIAAKENSSLPVFVTASFDERSKLLTGANPEAFCALSEGLGVSALGINCGLGPREMLETAKRLCACCSVPVIINPNAGLPKEVNGSTVYDISPKDFAAASKELLLAGARILGGCCGTTPAHIKAVTEALKPLSPLPLTDKNRTVISNGTHSVVFGEKPIIIGERINPTGKPKLKEALRSGNMDYIADAAVSQKNAGAHILDVNVGLPDIDEPEVMVNTVRMLRETVDLPLQIDTSNGIAMERAARIYNGKPLLNSVNGKAESMRAVFPIAKKYGGVIIALTLDENGIPDNAEGRVAIAEKILIEAEKWGIPKKDIIFDPLTLAVSSDKNAAKVTLEAVKRITEELGAKTSLGVTNVSFGLPMREKLNSSFLTMALYSGLSAAIMNPNSESMMNAVTSFSALSGLDEGFAEYIAASTAAVQTASAPAAAKKEAPVNELTLKQVIMNGRRKKAAELASELLKTKTPLEIINTEIAPALDETGKGFEAQRVFLPQLLMSAEAAGKAFEVVRAEMLRSGSANSKKYKIVLATVKGDIHDIGKNIVKTLLESYDYDIIDLGRDVEPERVLKAARESGAALVGLSALMTTTAPAMKATVELIKAKLPDCLTIVGGAVITEEYAENIGADAYASDAMAAVRYCEALYEKMKK